MKVLGLNINTIANQDDSLFKCDICVRGTPYESDAEYLMLSGSINSDSKSIKDILSTDSLHNIIFLNSISEAEESEIFIEILQAYVRVYKFSHRDYFSHDNYTWSLAYKDIIQKTHPDIIFSDKKSDRCLCEHFYIGDNNDFDMHIELSCTKYSLAIHDIIANINNDPHTVYDNLIKSSACEFIKKNDEDNEFKNKLKVLNLEEYFSKRVFYDNTFYNLNKSNKSIVTPEEWIAGGYTEILFKIVLIILKDHIHKHEAYINRIDYIEKIINIGGNK